MFFNLHLNLNLGDQKKSQTPELTLGNVAKEEVKKPDLTMNDLLAKTVDAAYEIRFDSKFPYLEARKDIRKLEKSKYGQTTTFQLCNYVIEDRFQAHLDVMRHALENNFSRICVIDCKIESMRKITEQEIADVLTYFDTEKKIVTYSDEVNLLVLSGSLDLEKTAYSIGGYQSADFRICPITEAHVFLIDAKSMKHLLSTFDNSYAKQQRSIADVYSTFTNTTCMFPRLVRPVDNAFLSYANISNAYRKYFNESTMVLFTEIMLAIHLFFLAFILIRLIVMAIVNRK